MVGERTVWAAASPGESARIPNAMMPATHASDPLCRRPSDTAPPAAGARRLTISLLDRRRPSMGVVLRCVVRVRSRGIAQRSGATRDDCAMPIRRVSTQCRAGLTNRRRIARVDGRRTRTRPPATEVPQRGAQLSRKGHRSPVMNGSATRGRSGAPTDPFADEEEGCGSRGPRVPDAAPLPGRGKSGVRRRDVAGTAVAAWRSATPTPANTHQMARASRAHRHNFSLQARSRGGLRALAARSAVDGWVRVAVKYLHATTLRLTAVYRHGGGSAWSRI